MATILGGWLIDEVGWRSIFMINLPLAAAALVLSSRFISLRVGIAREPLDVTGAALATIGLGALTFALIFGEGPAGWTMVTLWEAQRASSRWRASPGVNGGGAIEP